MAAVGFIVVGRGRLVRRKLLPGIRVRNAGRRRRQWRLPLSPPSVPPNQPSRDFFNILQVRLRSSHGTTYGTTPQGSEHESCICDLKPAATTHLPQFLRRHPALQIVPSQSVLPCLVRASRRRSRASSPRGYMRHKTASSLLRLAVPPAPRPS